MAKLIIACERTAQAPDALARCLVRASELLCPDNLTPHPPALVQTDGVAAVVFNPTPAVRVAERAIGLGDLTGDDWTTCGTARPEGTFALVRWDASALDVVSDAVATRTLWYAFDDERFLASTSQVALVALLGAFDPDPGAIGWMLTTGTLGPHAWDRRLKRLPGDTTLTLDRAMWSLSLDTRRVAFEAAPGSRDEHERRLLGALQHSIGSSNVSPDAWALPLSGGYDSRGILCLLPDRERLQSLTWGVSAALEQPGTDAYVAARLAEAFGTRHRYFSTDVDHADVGVETTLRRVLVCGEGRTDTLAAYMDGFAIWRTLFESGVHGVIRGDEGFGWRPVVSDREVRFEVGLPLAADFSNVAPCLEHLGGERSLHEPFERGDGESLATWRDRLYHEYRIPAVLAALSDLKLTFVELVNPLLAHEVVYAARRLPDDLRTEKLCFRRIVERIGPDVPFATVASIASPAGVLRSGPVSGYLRDELGSGSMEAVLPRSQLTSIIERLAPRSQAAAPRRARRKGGLRALIPRKLKDRLRGSVARPRLDPHVLAFRVFVAAKMHERLRTITLDR